MGILPFILGSPFDNEDYQYNIAATEEFRKGLLSGNFTFWSDLFGLGTPFPFTPNMVRHPIFFLFIGANTFFILKAIIVAHFFIGFVSWIRIFKSYQTSKLAAGVVLLTFYLGLPLQNYLYTDYWPCLSLVYLLIPVLLQLISDSLEKPTNAIIFGGLCGFLFSIGHPGYAAMIVFSFSLIGIFLLKTPKKILKFVSLSIFPFILLSASQTFDLLQAHIGAPAEVKKAVVFPLPWIEQFISMLFFPPHLATNFLAQYSRYIYLGPIGYLFLFSTKSKIATQWRFIFVAFLVMFFLPLEKLVPFIPSSYLLRDVFLLASLMFILTIKTHQIRVKVFLFSQVIYVILIYAFCIYQIPPNKPVPSSTLMLEKPSSVAKKIHRVYASDPGRIAFGKRIYDELHLHLPDFFFGRLQIEGMQVLNHRHAKGVSWEPIYPTQTKYYGTLPSSDRLTENQFLLDLLNIKYILSSIDDPKPPNSSLVETFDFENGKTSLLFKRNIDLSGPIVTDKNPNTFVIRSNHCEYPILRCLNVSELLKNRNSVQLNWKYHAGTVEVETSNLKSFPAYITLPVTYNSHWTIQQQNVELESLAGSLLVAKISSSTSVIKIQFEDTNKKLVYIFSSLFSFLLIGSLFWKISLPSIKFKN